MRNAPPRAAEIGATAIQIFTKQPSRWADPVFKPGDVEGFRAGVEEHGIGFCSSHDSYLINLATPNPELGDRSLAAFTAELRRSAELRLDAVVTHPGNATDGDVERGLAQNAELAARAMEEVGGGVRVLFENTAGTGTALGSTFEELAAILEKLPERLVGRAGVCVDSCHLFAAGYDLRGGYDSVIRQLDRVIGLERVGLLHMNDSKHPLGARKDRHAHIGEGTLGEEPFARLMLDPRLAHVPKVLETPKEGDATLNDRKNLARLQGFLRKG